MSDMLWMESHLDGQLQCVILDSRVHIVNGVAGGSMSLWNPMHQMESCTMSKDGDMDR